MEALSRLMPPGGRVFLQSDVLEVRSALRWWQVVGVVCSALVASCLNEFQRSCSLACWRLTGLLLSNCCRPLADLCISGTLLARCPCGGRYINVS